MELMDNRWLTPPDIARTLGVKVERVRGWIVSGELDAHNFSDARQPRYRVSPAAFEAFLRGRAVAEPPRPKRRRTQEPKGKYY